MISTFMTKFSTTGSRTWRENVGRWRLPSAWWSQWRGRKLHRTFWFGFIIQTLTLAESSSLIRCPIGKQWVSGWQGGRGSHGHWLVVSAVVKVLVISRFWSYSNHWLQCFKFRIGYSRSVKTRENVMKFNEFTYNFDYSQLLVWFGLKNFISILNHIHFIRALQFNARIILYCCEFGFYIYACIPYTKLVPE